MIAKRFKTTPCYGFVPKENTMFRDSELFGTEMWKYQILKKVKLWYGTAKSGDDYVKNKIVLGIRSGLVVQNIKIDFAGGSSINFKNDAQP